MGQDFVKVITKAIEAAANVAAAFGHGWAVEFVNSQEEFLKRINDAVSTAQSSSVFKTGAGYNHYMYKTIEAAIVDAYHSVGVAGPLGWGIEHPTVLGDEVIVQLGNHCRAEARISGDPLDESGEVIASVRNLKEGRELALRFKAGSVLVDVDEGAKARDYVRALAVIATAVGIDYEGRFFNMNQPQHVDASEFQRYLQICIKRGVSKTFVGQG